MNEKVKIVCMNCGSMNNYPMDAIDKNVVCGRCKTALPKPGHVIEPSLEQAVAFIQKSGLPVLIDFYSPTCAPCHMMHPVVERLAQRRAGELMAHKINVDQQPELSIQFGIQSVPTFIIFHKGKERARSSGAMSETDFSLWVASKI